MTDFLVVYYIGERVLVREYIYFEYFSFIKKEI